jgi:hypothetical protein
MGDSKSWGYEQESKVVQCKHGNYHKYFDKCQCRPCIESRDDQLMIRQLSEKIASKATGVLHSVPRDEIALKAQEIMDRIV